MHGQGGVRGSVTSARRSLILQEPVQGLWLKIQPRLQPCKHNPGLDTPATSGGQEVLDPKREGIYRDKGGINVRGEAGGRE